MKRSLVIAGLVLCGSIVGCSVGVQGSGVEATEKREVPAFTAIEVTCVGSVKINCQAAQDFLISGDDNIVPLITTEVKGDTLHVGSKEPYHSQKELVINISVPDVQKLVFTGVGDVELENVKNDRLAIEVQGSVNVHATGETHDAEFRLLGVGNMNAQELHADNVTVNSSGTGTVNVYASKRLDGKLNGVGDLNYYGNPATVNAKMIGVGILTPK